MFLRNLVLIASLREIYSGLIEFLAWDGTLLKEFLTAVVDFLLGIQHLFGRLRV